MVDRSGALDSLTSPKRVAGIALPVELKVAIKAAKQVTLVITLFRAKDNRPSLSTSAPKK
jgi:hypothetical protein